MKPDAWIQSNHLPVKAAAMCRLADHKLHPDFIPLYSAETIRKWLEEPSEAMVRAAMQAYLDAKRSSGSEFTAMCRATLAAKLKELK